MDGGRYHFVGTNFPRLLFVIASDLRGKTLSCAVSIKLTRTASTRSSILNRLTHLGRGLVHVAALCMTVATSSYAQSHTSIKTLSTKPDYVTDGDVLVQVTAPGVAAQAFRVRVGVRDVTRSF